MHQQQLTKGELEGVETDDDPQQHDDDAKDDAFHSKLHGGPTINLHIDVLPWFSVSDTGHWPGQT